MIEWYIVMIDKSLNYKWNIKLLVIMLKRIAIFLEKEGVYILRFLTVVSFIVELRVEK